MLMREVMGCILVIVFFFAYAYFIKPAQKENQQLEEQIAQMQAQLNQQNEEIQVLTNEYFNLQKGDPETVEKALKLHGYCRPNETMVIFEKKKNTKQE